MKRHFTRRMAYMPTYSKLESCRSTQRKLFNYKLKLYILYYCAFLSLSSSESGATLHAQSGISRLFEAMYCDEIPAYTSMVENSVLDFQFRNDFCTPELMYKALTVSLTHGDNTFMATLSHDGYSHFGEMQATIGYARRFGKRFSIAMRGIYLLRHAEHYVSQHSITIDVSSYCHITPHWGIAVELYNPIRLRRGITGPEIIPMEFALHLDYQWNEKLMMHFRAHKWLPGSFDASAGLLCRPISHLLLAGECGLHKLAIGIYIPWRHLLIGINTAWYYRISFSNTARLQYLFNL